MRGIFAHWIPFGRGLNILKTKINMKIIFLKETLPDDLELREVILGWLKELSIPMNEGYETNFGLYYDKGQIYLNTQAIKQEGFSPLCFNFMSHIKYHNTQSYSLKREPLAKALGMKKNPHPHVLDATCGEGKDTLLMLNFGAKVSSYERNPVIALLLLDAQRRLRNNPETISIYKDNFEFFPYDSRTSEDFISRNRPDVIYFDPMYKSDKKRTAKPRKEMQIFEEVVGKDSDSLEFFEWATSIKPQRIVVKRSLHADPIKEGPSYSIKGKSTRYDVYLIS